jgi:hypothetical protein
MKKTIPIIAIAPLFLMAVGLSGSSQLEADTPSTVTVYSVPPGENLITDHAVTVSGTTVPIIASSKNYAHFAFDGTVEVQVTNVEGWTLSPTDFNIPVKWDGSTMIFSLSQPRKLVIHNKYSNDPNQFILIFADAPEKDAPSQKDPNVLDVGAMGLDATGANDVTYGLQTALNQAAASDLQKTVYIPPGTYKVQALRINSNTKVYLAGGAKLSFTGSIAIPNSNCAGSGGYNDNGCFVFDQVQNATLFGRGVLEGNYVDAHLIQAYKCKNITIEGVIAREAGAYHTIVTRCDGVLISNYKVIQALKEHQ